MSELNANSIAEDRVGLGWRPELGIDILGQLDSVDIIEVVAENCIHLSNKDLKAFSRLSSQVDIVVHALSLGLASTYPVSIKHVEKVAKVVNSISPEAWSEHLAFVRTDNKELGHLAAPPWSEETAENTVVNINKASQIVGSVPHMENIATYYPAGSTMSESDWTREIILSAKTRLLIDLENIYANSKNFKKDWLREMLNFPLTEVSYVHIAGGKEVEDENGKYFIDDHMHSVADEVFVMLEELAARVPQALTVILERDGDYPQYEQINNELTRARQALARGRALKGINEKSI